MSGRSTFSLIHNSLALIKKWNSRVFSYFIYFFWKVGLSFRLWIKHVAQASKHWNKDILKNNFIKLLYTVIIIYSVQFAWNHSVVSLKILLFNFSKDKDNSYFIPCPLFVEIKPDLNNEYWTSVNHELWLLFVRPL